MRTKKYFISIKVMKIVFMVLTSQASYNIVHDEYYWLCDKLLMFLYFKSFWVKASAKHISVNTTIN